MNTGNRVVDEISKINFSGNVIPQNWFKHIRFDDNKPDTVAIILLADIIYWYRHTEIRDEISGLTIGYRKKFKADKLQKNYSAMAEQYGFTKRQVQDAMNRLKSKGIIIIELRTVTTTTGSRLGNVVFIEPVADVINKLTHPITPESDPSHVETGEAITFERETNTEITYTENTTNNDNHNGATSRSALPYQKINDVDNSNTDIIHQVVTYYLSVYEKEFKEEHPKLKKAQWSRIRGVLSYFADDNMLDYDSFATMIDRHFERSMETDYNINHFATEGVLTNLFYEAAY